MTEENLSQKFRLKSIYKTRNDFFKEQSKIKYE